MAEGKGRKERIAERAEELLQPIVETCGVTIYDVEYVKEAEGQVLRAYIDKKPGGVTIDDCEAVSRAFSDALDADDFIPDAYTLEVSSPGLGRQLKKDRHFAQSLGEEVELKTFREVDGSKNFVGILTGFDKETVTIRLADTDEEKVFVRKELAIIRLTIDF